MLVGSGPTGLLHRGGQLLDEERVALRDLHDLVGAVAVAEPSDGELARLRRRAGRASGRVAREPAPHRPRVEQLGSGERDDQDRQPPDRVASASIRSSRFVSAQWMSSKTSTVGCSRATASRNLAGRGEECFAVGRLAPGVEPDDHAEMPGDELGSASAPARSSRARS